MAKFVGIQLIQFGRLNDTKNTFYSNYIAGLRPPSRTVVHCDDGKYRLLILIEVNRAALRKQNAAEV